MSEMTIDEYKARIDAKYAGAPANSTPAESKRKDHWLLVGPNGEVDGVVTRRIAKSAAEAFDTFFEQKRERYAASAEGWHIEVDDVNGSRWAASCEAHTAVQS